MSEINLYPEMNEKIADFLLGCTDNGMLLYAGAYIKDLERQLAEQREAEGREKIIKIPVDKEKAVYSIEYCCGLNQDNKSGLCHRGFCRECADKKLHILETTADASCRIAELGKTVFFSRRVAEYELARLGREEGN